MGEEKDGGHNQAYMKCKGDYGQYRVSSHVHRGKGRDPVENRTDPVSPAHVGKDESFLSNGQNEHRDQPIEAAADKQDEGRPCQGTGYKKIYIVHSSPSTVSIRLLE